MNHRWDKVDVQDTHQAAFSSLVPPNVQSSGLGFACLRLQTGQVTSSGCLSNP